MAIDLNKPVKTIVKAAAKRIMDEKLPGMKSFALFSEKGLVICTDDVTIQFNTSSGAEIKKAWKEDISNYFDKNKPIVGRAFPFERASLVACRVGEAPSIFSSFLELDPRTNLFVLYHELGHVLDKKYVTTDFYKREDFADTFASLMYARDFGADADIFSYAPYTLARDAFSELKEGFPGQYYSSSVVMAAQRVSENIDIKNISADEALFISDKIVNIYSLPREKKVSIYNEFNKAANSGSENKMVIKTMLNTNCHDTYRAGALALQSQLFKNDIEFIRKNQFITGVISNLAFKKIHKRKENDDNIKGIILNPVDAIDAERGVNGVNEIVQKLKSRRKRSVAFLNKF